MRAVAIVAALLSIPAVAQAQWRDRGRISVNAGLEGPAATTFTSTMTKTVNVETATIGTSYNVPKSRFFDGGLLIRLRRNFGIGAAVSSFTNSDVASVSGAIPHPFFFTTLRPLSGSTPALERSETAVHVQAAYVISSKRWDLALALGPTLFYVSQDLVADVIYTEAYPYDTITFTGVALAKASTTKAGFNASADVGVKLSKSVGVGGLVRFSRATADFPLAGTAAGASASIGGVQAAGGIRFFF
jgi:hypothetical protein